MPVDDVRSQGAIDPILFNNFEVRLTAGADDVAAVQALRYRVFYEEMAAQPTDDMRSCRRDYDAFDMICDHLMVRDLEDMPEGQPRVVGTYRLLRRSVADLHSGFYTSQEYDLSTLMAHPGEIVELGRSCVDPEYRTKGVMQLLWRGLAAYVIHYDIYLMFGCASFPGTEPEEMNAALSYLHHYHLAPQSLRPRALDNQYVEMHRLPRASIDVQSAVNDLPPLIKGYLRVGGFVGDGAVVDEQFGTTDVCMIVKTDLVTKKYDRHYRRPFGDRVAA